jgi:hypothetical protein
MNVEELFREGLRFNQFIAHLSESRQMYLRRDYFELGLKDRRQLMDDGVYFQITNKNELMGFTTYHFKDSSTGCLRNPPFDMMIKKNDGLLYRVSHSIIYEGEDDDKLASNKTRVIQLEKGAYDFASTHLSGAKERLYLLLDKPLSELRGDDGNLVYEFKNIEPVVKQGRRDAGKLDLLAINIDKAYRIQNQS